MPMEFNITHWAFLLLQLEHRVSWLGRRKKMTFEWTIEGAEKDWKSLKGIKLNIHKHTTT